MSDKLKNFIKVGMFIIYIGCCLSTLQYISLVIPAYTADKTVWVVCPSHGRDHLSSDVLLTAVTLGPIQALVVLSTDVLPRVVEETRVHQVTATH